jgi:hypothetical protein
VVIEKDSRILGNSHNFKPLRRLDVDADAELSQVVDIVDAPEAESILALHTIAKLPAELNPGRERFIERRDREQPTIWIGSEYAKVCRRVRSARRVRSVWVGGGRTIGLGECVLSYGGG